MPSTFSENSNIKTLSKQVNIFHIVVKKLKGYDLPDILQAVQNKKLPKEALRGVLGRFKLNGEKLELIDSVENLRENAKK